MATLCARLFALILLGCVVNLPVTPAQAQAQTQAQPRPGAAVPSQAAVVSAKRVAWVRDLMARLVRVKWMPPNHATGELLLRFTVNPDGRVSGVVIAKSSGDTALDNHAASVMRRAGPFSPPPASMLRGGGVRVTLPVAFNPSRPQPVFGTPL